MNQKTLRLVAVIVSIAIIAAIVLPAVEAQVVVAKQPSNADADESPKFFPKHKPRGKPPTSAITNREDIKCGVELIRLVTASGQTFTYPDPIQISEADLKTATLYIKTSCDFYKYTYDFYHPAGTDSKTGGAHDWLKTVPANITATTSALAGRANSEVAIIPDATRFDKVAAKVADKGSYSIGFEICRQKTSCSDRWIDSPQWTITFGEVTATNPYFSKFVQGTVSKTFAQADTKAADLVFEQAFTLEAQQLNPRIAAYLRLDGCASDENAAGTGDSLLKKIDAQNVTAKMAFDFAANSWNYSGKRLYLCQYSAGAAYSDSITLTTTTTAEKCAETGNLVYCLALIDRRMVSNLFGTGAAVEKEGMITAKSLTAAEQPTVQPQAQPQPEPQPQAGTITLSIRSVTVGDKKRTLSWTSFSGTQKYYVYYCDGPIAPATITDADLTGSSIGCATKLNEVTASSWVDSDAARLADTDDRYKVVSVSNNKVLAQSAWVQPQR